MDTNFRVAERGTAHQDGERPDDCRRHRTHARSRISPV
jgi:hypothetical protein